VYSTLPTFVLGFHGCDESVGEAILDGVEDLKPSENDYDWLGHGVYFWEQNPARALEYAVESRAFRRNVPATVEKPFALGAIIDLGHCLNLVESASLRILASAFEDLRAAMAEAGQPMPTNSLPEPGGHHLLRRLDCAVIEFMHTQIERERADQFDSVRGVFFEGAPLYPGAGFKEKNHIQICVRNPNCIKGFFRLRRQDCDFVVP